MYAIPLPTSYIFLTKHRKIHRRLIVYPSRWDIYFFFSSVVFFILANLYSLCAAFYFAVKLFHFRPFHLFYFFTFSLSMEHQQQTNNKKKRTRRTENKIWLVTKVEVKLNSQMEIHLFVGPKKSYARQPTLWGSRTHKS